jgi:molybdate transport system regulatory protein
MGRFPAISLRLDLGPGRRLGPGKIDLLAEIATKGSITAAARAMGMSYRRAWLLVAECNRLFGAPLVRSAAGGTRGGGAALTPLGRKVIAAFRAIEGTAARGARKHLAAIAGGKPLKPRKASARRSKPT